MVVVMVMVVMVMVTAVVVVVAIVVVRVVVAAVTVGPVARRAAVAVGWCLVRGGWHSRQPLIWLLYSFLRDVSLVRKRRVRCGGDGTVKCEVGQTSG